MMRWRINPITIDAASPPMTINVERTMFPCGAADFCACDSFRIIRVSLRKGYGAAPRRSSW
ncbi:MAG: hypothetical protein P8Z34_05185 [Anaerolineales bacterium]